MSIATEIPSERPASDAGQVRFRSGEATQECDRCGRTVRREAAFEQIQRGGDELEVVLLCAECEFGSD